MQKQANATIMDVAHRAGVSITTVSRLLNKTTPVAEATAKRIWQAIDELNFVPHAAARMLASRKTQTIGLVLDAISGPFFPPMLSGVETCAQENGYGLLIYTKHGSMKPENPHTQPLGPHNTDGLIVFTNSLSTEEITRLHARHFPMVLLFYSAPEGLDIPCVLFENKSGASQLIDHLIVVHKYRRIAFLRGPQDNEDSCWRERGYHEALEKHGIPFDPHLVAPGDFNEAVARRSVERWMEKGVPMDAIFAGDDESAVGAIAAINQNGKRVPQDIAVVGFDDNPTVRHLPTPLTTVRAPIERAGWEAVRQLIRLMRTEKADPEVLLPTELVVRQSCGCR